MLLRDLENPDLSEPELKSCGNRLRNVYMSGNGDLYRHSYSEITRYMYEEHVTDDVPSTEPGSMVLEHLKTVEDDWESNLKNATERENLCNAIRKLIDHISLEVVRLGQMADIYYKLTKAGQLQEQIQSVKKEIEDANSQIQAQKEEAKQVSKDLGARKKEVEEIQTDVKNHNTQAITVLSIFSCVVFAFTGGFSLLAGSLGVLDNISRRKSFLLIGILTMLCMVLVDMIYMLLRAARHYSSGRQGHLGLFIFANIVGFVVVGLIFGIYFLPALFPLFYPNS